MSSSRQPPASHRHDDSDDDSDADSADMLDADDALEEVEGGDVAMDSGDEDDEELGDVEVTLENDSVAHVDAHASSVFAIAVHPLDKNLVATGGSAGEEDDAPGEGYLFSAGGVPERERPVLPASFNAAGGAADGREAEAPVQIEPIQKLEGHTDSITALAFTLPRGNFLASGGMDGRLRVWAVTGAGAGPQKSSGSNPPPPKATFVDEVQEVPEVNWVAACPSTTYPDAVALGGSDGSVWVYTLDPGAAATPNPAAGSVIQLVQSYFLHTSPTTAGTWSPDGSLLASVGEDGALFVYDVWGLAAAKGAAGGVNSQTAVALTAADARFVIEGGLYSVAIDPRSTMVAVGGAQGAIRVVSLPRLEGGAAASSSAGKGAKGGKARAGASSSAGASPGGAILAALQAQSDSIEALAFSPLPRGVAAYSTAQPLLLAAGSVDGSVAVYDASRGFAARRVVAGAHGEHSVVKVAFVDEPDDRAAWLLTTAGMDGVVRRWDVKSGGGTGGDAAAAGLVKEWRGHRGGGEGGGVLGFVQWPNGNRVITAGDDGLVLVFDV